MKQYETWWAALPRPIGRRPVLLLSRNDAYTYLTRFLVVEITTIVRNIPQELPLGRPEGLRRNCVANCDNVHTIPRDALKERIGALAPVRQHELKRALGQALEWYELIGASPVN